METELEYIKKSQELLTKYPKSISCTSDIWDFIVCSVYHDLSESIKEIMPAPLWWITRCSKEKPTDGCVEKLFTEKYFKKYLSSFPNPDYACWYKTRFEQYDKYSNKTYGKIIGDTAAQIVSKITEYFNYHKGYFVGNSEDAYRYLRECEAFHTPVEQIKCTQKSRKLLADICISNSYQLPTNNIYFEIDGDDSVVILCKDINILILNAVDVIQDPMDKSLRCTFVADIYINDEDAREKLRKELRRMNRTPNPYVRWN